MGQEPTTESPEPAPADPSTDEPDAGGIEGVPGALEPDAGGVEGAAGTGSGPIDAGQPVEDAPSEPLADSESSEAGALP